MNCRTLHDRIDDWLEGRLTSGESEAAEAHLAACGECRELVAVLRGECTMSTPAPPAGLVESILERTSGSPCSRALDLVPGYVDGELDEVESGLVTMHSEHCERCAEIAVTMRRLSLELPKLAELQPDVRFVDDVLAATLPWHRRVVRRLRAATDAGRRIALRPRFAMEAAYVLALAVVLVFGVPDLRATARVPDRALELPRIHPVDALVGPGGPVDTLRRETPVLVREAVGAAAGGERGAQVVQETTGIARTVWSAVKDTGSRAIESIRGDLERSDGNDTEDPASIEHDRDESDTGSKE